MTRKVALSSIDKNMYRKVSKYKKTHDTPKEGWTAEEITYMSFDQRYLPLLNNLK